MTSAALPAATVKPSSGRLESLIIWIACAVIAVGCVSYATARAKQHPVPKLLQWQVSALGGLSVVDQAIHSSLLAAADEIAENYTFTSRWKTVKDLAERLNPPFYQDAFWKENGSVTWTLHAANPDDTAAGAYYMGTGGKAQGQGAYLLIMAHVHAGIATAQQNTVWIHPKNNPPPPTVVKPEALIRQGWKQVIAYRGADELRNLKGR